MKTEDDPTKVEDGPTENEKSWLIAAIVTFAFAVAAFGFAAIWTFSEEGQEAVYRAQAFAPFGIALGAIVTFFTVIWRGILSTKQLNVQAEQLKQQIDQVYQVIRQNDAKEDENLVKLLQEGAKFITENQKKPQMMAGIASLDVLISNDVKRRYSVQAMDILAGFYAQNYQDGDDAIKSARRALCRASEADVRSTVDARFMIQTEERYEWPIVRGFATQSYQGGHFSPTSFNAMVDELYEMAEVSFRNCTIRRGFYSNCRFVGCKISSFDPDDLKENTFVRSDFSGCRLDEVFAFVDLKTLDLRDGHNFFYSDNPPISRDPVEWSTVLVEKPAAERSKTRPVEHN